MNTNKSIIKAYFSGFAFPLKRSVVIHLPFQEVKNGCKDCFYTQEKVLNNQPFEGWFISENEFVLSSKKAHIPGYRARANGVLYKEGENDVRIEIATNGNVFLLIIPLVCLITGTVKIAQVFFCHRESVQLLVGLFILLIPVVIIGMYKGMNTAIIEDFEDFVSKEMGKKN